ncbi:MULTISPECIES: hypothetical protein [unclassified Cryobacterium]|uniref:hypothetical protein n=1 Tax=unclassified Cryobacterium TaxID=2649013 RepID=UPI00106BF31F|nr:MULTISPECIES: hypothetical protein [unclassified Cryobacterium]TFD07453.1 hypothetical protein E3T29_06025 [Cryobacterium sp. TMT1-66-1]TFD14348.1 hypothetical protein E3T35_02845 [Cryobacterium sp. TMT1-2-2]
MSIRNRLIGATIAVVATAVVLSGCSSPTFAPFSSTSTATPVPSGTAAGISRDEAVAFLNAVPGLRDATVRSSTSGLSTSMIIEVYVDDDAAATAPGVLDYVLRLGWATALDRQPSSLRLIVYNHGRTVDLQAEANVLAGVEYPMFQKYSVYFDGPEYLGAWPGAVPTLSVG